MPNPATNPDPRAAGGRRLRVGSLFSGYGGLDPAVEQVFGGETVWFSEFSLGNGVVPSPALHALGALYKSTLDETSRATTR